MKYILTGTYTQHGTFTAVVEAEDEEEAKELFANGEVEWEDKPMDAEFDIDEVKHV